MKVDVSASPGSVTIRTLHPLDHFGNAGVHYEIRVPRGANLDRIVTSNGPIRLDDLDGSVRARTSNGPVNASRLRGSLDVETSNGPVDASELKGAVMVHTSNGPIRLAMEAVREVRAATSNGPITVRVPEGRKQTCAPEPRMGRSPRTSMLTAAGSFPRTDWKARSARAARFGPEHIERPDPNCEVVRSSGEVDLLYTSQ